MIDSGKRVVVFLDSGADTSVVNFILPEFQMVSPIQKQLAQPRRIFTREHPCRSGKRPSVLLTPLSRVKSIGSVDLCRLRTTLT